ncbi:MAG: hypothetical protein ACRBB4_05620 [Neptuniibacter sp.]
MDNTTLFKAMQTQNLNCLAMFYKHVSIAIKDVAKEIDDWEEIDKTNKAWWKSEFETHYPQKMKDTTFLLMFGHLEEMLVLLQKSFNPEKTEIDSRESSIKKFKPYIKSLLGDHLKHYQYLVEAHTIRNSLIHCAGRIDLMSDTSKVEKILSRNPDLFGIKNKRVYVKLKGLGKMQKSIHKLTEELLNKSMQPTAKASAV